MIAHALAEHADVKSERFGDTAEAHVVVRFLGDRVFKDSLRPPAPSYRAQDSLLRAASMRTVPRMGPNSPHVVSPLSGAWAFLSMSAPVSMNSLPSR